MAQAIGETERLRAIKPIQPWDRAGVSESQWNEMDALERHWAKVRNEDQSIRPTGDEALPFTLGPLVANIAKYGVGEAQRQLLKRRLVKDSAGKPRPFYHGTRAKFEGDIRPTGETGVDFASYAAVKSPALRRRLMAERAKNHKLYMSTEPRTAGYYSMARRPWENASGLQLDGARTYKKYLAPMRGKNRGVRFDKAQRFSNSRADELHAVISNPRVLVSPWEIAPKPLPNMAPLTAPVLMDSMILREGE